MSTSNGGEIHHDLRRLRLTDVSDCCALSDEAGWNQTRQDWSFIISQSESWGIVSGSGQVIATAVAFTTPETRWIAMVLVAGEWRGHGLASRILSRMSVGSESGCSEYLDATQLGAPVYRKRGFARVGIVNRYLGEVGAGTKSVECSEAMHLIKDIGLHPDWRLPGKVSPWCPEIIGYSEAAAPASCFAIDGPRGRGAIWARPGRLAWQLGPLVATNVCLAGELLDACLSTLEGPVILDVTCMEEGLDSLLEKRGFAISREFERMCCGPEIPMDPSGLHRYATAGPDFG